MPENRLNKYHKDEKEEELSRIMNLRLIPVEAQFLKDKQLDRTKHPVLIIIGAPRSGTTLLHQVLASTGNFGYISNFVARFWEAPYFGALLEKLLGVRKGKEIELKSDHGRTEFLHSPHDFAYFWERWFKAKNDMSLLVEEVAALESVYRKPMMFKNLLCSFQIPYIKSCFPKAKFVVCVRSIRHQMQSILESRKSYYGNYDGWFSIKPPEYDTLKKLSPYEQVSGQIHYTLQSIHRGVGTLELKDYTIVEYAKFVDDPNKVVKHIFNKMRINETPKKKFLPLINRNTQRVSRGEWDKIEEQAWRLWK